MTLRQRLVLHVGLTLTAALAAGATAFLERWSEVRLEAVGALALEMVHQASDANALVARFAHAPSPDAAGRIDTVLRRLRRTGDSLARLPGASPEWSGRVVPRVHRLPERFRALRDAGPAGAASSEAIAVLNEARLLLEDAWMLTEQARAAAVEADRRLDTNSAVALAALVGTLLAMTWWLVTSLGRRLWALHGGAMALAEGDLGYRVPASGADELGALVTTFNRMAAEVEGAITYARLKVDELDTAQAVLRRRVRQQAAVVELGARALAEGPLVELEDEAVRRVAAELGVEFATVLVREPATEGLRVAAGFGWGPGVVVGTVVPADTSSQAGFTLHQRVPVVVDDLARETRFAGPALLAEHGVQSGISVVIGEASQPFGVLSAHSVTRRTFTEDDVAFVQAVANLLAQTLSARAAGDALRESEQRYLDLYDNAPALYWSVELSAGRILACNRTAAHVLGYGRNELVGRSVFDLYVPECHADVRAGMAELRARGEVRDQILAVRRRDGSMMDISLQATAVRDDAGAVVASRSTWLDITARRRAERALERSRDRLAQAERIALIGHWHWDAATNRVTWSEGLQRLLGLEDTALEGRPEDHYRRVHPEDRDRVRAWIGRLLERGEGGETEYRIVRPDGQVRQLFATVEAKAGPDGRVRSMFGISVDVTERRRLEEQLRHVVEHSTNLFYSHTADHVLTYVSPQSREIFDCEPEEALIRWTEFLTDHPDNQAGVVATERAIATGQRQPPYELQLRTARGRVIWVEVREAPLVRDGKTVAIVGALTDITQRRQVEDALRRERELLDQTVNNAPVMFVTLDAAGRVLFVNRAWERTLGWGLGECRVHEDLMGALYPDAGERHRMLEHVRDATGDWADFRTRVRDGRVLDTLWAHVRLSDGTLIGIGQDVTERKAAERALIESEERLRLAVTAANQGLFDADLRTGVSVVSPEYCRMLGYEPDELEVTHESWLERLHPEDRAGTLQRFRDYVEGRNTEYAAEFRLRHRDGRWRWILSVGKIVEWRAGRPIRFLGTHTDITARRLAEEEVRASRQQLRELGFAQEQAREAERARLARELHDEMGQALTGFKMDLSWLRDRIPGEDTDARDRAAEALGLVNVMVDVVRRMSGELRPGVLDDLGLGPAIRWQVREFQRRAGLAALLEGLDEVPDMDPERALAVFRIVQEALTNVARHAHATAVWITVSADDERLWVEVRDDGRGLPPLAPADRVPLGILGMQERAAAWGGTLSVRNASPAGTVVTLQIPVAMAAGVAA